MNYYDLAVFEGDINKGESESLEVSTSKSRTSLVIAVVTDAGGNDAPTFDLTIQIYPPGVTEFNAITARVKESQSVRYHERAAVPDKMRYTVTNQSGAVGSYRFLLIAVGQPF